VTPEAVAADLAAEESVLRALARAAIYRLLGGAFAHPTAERLGDLARAACETAEAAPTPDAVRDQLAALAAAAGASDAASVAGEYVFLFERQVRCPPHEGAWGDRPQLAGKAATLADIAGFYSAFGLVPEGSQPDTEDHLVAELEYMSILALKEAWALARGERDAVEVTRHAAAAFLAEHLGRWAPTFAAELTAASPLPYYTAAAALLTRWLALETDGLDVASAPVAGRLPDTPLEAETFTCPLAEPEEDEEAAPDPA
jgi:TorA maturation chaperone TorD